MNTKSGLCALLLAVAVAVATATADHDGDDNRQLLRGKYWPWGNARTGCGYIPPQCCCIEGQTDCRTPVCEIAAANGGKLPCGGGDFYTIGSKIVCKGSGNPIVNPNRGDQDDEETVGVGDSDSEDTETSDGSAKCTIENWNLEGRGEEYSCESNDDCKYGCCSTGQVEGKCISPFINPAFSDFLGCRPEFSECETNRVDEESPYTDEDGKLESEYQYGIDQCDPDINPAAAGVTKCCETSEDCEGFGEECCDQVRLQCVPNLGNPVMIQKFNCLKPDM
jgi:hypothetical protein